LITLLGFKVDDSGREQYNKGIDQTKQRQQSLAASFLKANLIMSAASRVMGAAFGFIRDAVIGTTAEIERYRVTLGTMMGDQEKANKIIHDLDYGVGLFQGSKISDFYGTASAIGGLEHMVTFGMQAEEAGEILTRLGDIAQGNSEAFVSMSHTMGKVFANGKADAITLKQFMMQGFDVIGEVQKQTGKSREELQKAGVTYEQTAKALRALTSEGGKYNGMLAKQSNTLGGILKQYASFKAILAEAIGTGISDELKELLKYILQIGKAGQENFVGVFVGALKEVIHWIFQIIIMWKVLCFRIADMGDALAPVKQFFSGLKDAAGDVLTGIMILAVELGKLIVAAFKPVQAFASPIIKEFGATAKDVFTAIAKFIRPLIPLAERSAGFFGVLGKAVAGLIRPALLVAGGLRGIFGVIAVGKGAVNNFNKAMNLATGIQGLFKGNLTQVGMAFRAFGLPQDKVNRITEAFSTWKGRLIGFKDGALNVFGKVGSALGELGGKIASVTKALLANAAAALKAAGAWIKNTAQVVAHKIATVAMAAAQKAAALASKAWAAVQAVLNAIMAANPIVLIIIAVAALIAVIILLVKNWDTVKTALIKGAAVIGAFFRKAWEGIKKAASMAFNVIKTIIMTYVNIYKAIFMALIKFYAWLWNGIITVAKIAWEGLKAFFTGLVEWIKTIWNGIVGFFKKWGELILQILAVVIFGIPGLIAVAVRQIIKHWDVIGPKVKAIWEKIKAFFIALGRQIANIFLALSNKIKQAFQWVVDRAIAIWDTLKSWFGVLVEAIKGIWLSITGWFAGLWNGIVNTAMAIWDTLKSWFSGLVEGIKTIWNGITGFFSGLWEALKEGPAAAIEYIKNAFFGLFNSLQEKLFGFINKIKEGWETVKGFFGDIAGGVVNFLTGGESGQMQPAYAGSASQAAMAGAVGQTSNYAYTSTGGSSTVNAQTSINVNVPPGTPQEQSLAIARQVDAQFEAKFAGSINSSRANIPSPEVRRR
jgi:phage-related protein